MSLRGPFELRALPESELPMTVAGRLEFVAELLRGSPITNDEGETVGYTEPMITKAQAAKMLEGID